jgi:hypothetical protein
LFRLASSCILLTFPFPNFFNDDKNRKTEVKCKKGRLDEAEKHKRTSPISIG